MRGRKVNLGCPGVAAIIDKRHASEKPGWLKDRMLSIKLAAKGEYTSQEIGEYCGLSRSKVFELLKAVRSHGLGDPLQPDLVLGKKLGGVLRPRHSKNDPAAAEAFRKEMSSKPWGSRVEPELGSG